MKTQIDTAMDLALAAGRQAIKNLPSDGPRGIAWASIPASDPFIDALKSVGTQADEQCRWEAPTWLLTQERNLDPDTNSDLAQPVNCYALVFKRSGPRLAMNYATFVRVALTVLQAHRWALSGRLAVKLDRHADYVAAMSDAAEARPVVSRLDVVRRAENAGHNAKDRESSGTHMRALAEVLSTGIEAARDAARQVPDDWVCGWAWISLRADDPTVAEFLAIGRKSGAIGEREGDGWSLRLDEECAPDKNHCGDQYKPTGWFNLAFAREGQSVSRAIKFTETLLEDLQANGWARSARCVSMLD